MNLIQFCVEGTSDSTWELMCKLRLNRQSREIDVVIGIPRLGLFILELKGWRNMGLTSDGRIYKIDNGERNSVKDPYVQLSAEISAVSELFRHRLNHRPTIFGAVVYSGMSAHSLSKLVNEAPNVFPEELSLTLGDFLTHNSLSEHESNRLIEQIKKMATVESNRHRREHHKNDAETISAALDLLRKEVEVDFLDQELKDITDAVEQNTQYSIELLQRPLSGIRKLHVLGPAGTGKTVLALSIAQERSLTLKSPSLFLCFSEHLREFIVHRRSRTLNPSVWVETPESLYLRLTGKEFTPQILEETRTNSLSEIGVILPSEVSETDRLYVCQDQIWIEILEKLENLDIKFAAVCIDEGQDFWGPLYQVLDEQTMDEGTFAIFADEHQTTRTRATFRPYELERPGFHEVHLRANLRNSPAIAKEINREFSPLVEYQVNGLLQSGAPPTTYLWASNPQLWQQLESVYAEIKKTLSTDVVLLLDSECSTTTRNMLARTAEIFSWKVYTVDEFKGLECDIVIAVNSKRDGITNAIEALWKQRYVAYSRTRGFLYILQESTDDAQLNAKYRPKKKKSSPRNES
jgi:hypothetical protein